ncbi:MAG: hypothetical protein JWQ89_946 [Devosia sp.]|nr:hypothetical protein [Devosia sp.]
MNEAGTGWFPETQTMQWRMRTDSPTGEGDDCGLGG